MKSELLNNLIYDGDMTETDLHELLLEFFYQTKNMSMMIENKYMLTFRKMRLFLDISLLDFDILYNEYSLLLDKPHKINLSLLK